MPDSPRKPLPTYDQALAIALRHAPAVGDEQVDLPAALGRVLRRDVKADRDQPPFDRSAMDGFAVQSTQIAAGRTYRVAGSITAGASAPLQPAGYEPQASSLKPQAYAVLRIATGAAVPAGLADAVIPLEQAAVEGPANAELVRFTVDAAKPGANIHRRASDAAAGQVVIARGARLGPQHVGIAAAVGDVTLTVASRPRVTLLTTGDEVRPRHTPGRELAPEHIRNSNAPMAAALLALMGADVLAHEHVPDESQRTLAAAREALSRSQLVVTVGGVSAGQRDYLPWAWKELGLRTLVQGVAIQPGKPLFIATDGDKLAIGLPGNPVSAWATMHLFVWAVLRQMMGEKRDPNIAGSDPISPVADDPPLPWRRAILAMETSGSSKREVFRAARWTADGKAEVIRWHGSGDLVHTAAAEGLLRFPLTDDPLPPGTEAQWLDLAGG